MLSKIKAWRENKRAQRLDYMGAFGKLPVQAEFIKWGMTDPLTRELDLWYQRAYSKLNHALGEQGKYLFSEMPCYQFIYHIPKAQPLLGSVFSSRDASGRRYPFVILRRVNHPVATEFFSVIPLVFDDYFSATERFHKQCTEQQTLNQAFQAFNKLALTSYPLSKWPSLEKAWQQSRSHAIPEKLQRFKEDPLPKTYRFDLPRQGDIRVQVVKYFQCIETNVALRDHTWQLFWQYGGKHHKPHMLFSKQPLPSDDWMVFVSE